MHPPADSTLTIDRKEFARLAGLNPRTLDRHRRELPTPIRIGSRLLWSRSEVLAFLRAKGQTA